MAGQTRTSVVDIDDTDFRQGLERAFAALKLESADELRRMAIDIQNRARELAPVDTGRLRSSIQHQTGRDRRGPYVDVGSFSVHYAVFVEFGTSRMRSQPFLRPAFAEAVSAWSAGRYRPRLRSL